MAALQWRETASIEAQADLDDLFADSVRLAARVLESGDEFAPFMLAIGAGGARSVRFSEGSTRSRSKDVIRQALGTPADRGTLRARALILDVTIAESGVDAIEVQLEHVEGVAIDLTVPYRVAGGKLDLQRDATTAASGSHVLWGGLSL